MQQPNVAINAVFELSVWENMKNDKCMGAFIVKNTIWYVRTVDVYHKYSTLTK